ncbi:MAG: class I SAM-dependent methyltransferase [Eubacteriales bacterium]|nr:class I SAM-dependent methyltransferase [Eubacteriales bacterium]MDD3880849.1 class I SAM-dependent methyltransferase [Eubacteriales bacterium]MDD4511784.1 class I SAM-dependent methyltransferase [Eubacteriales bacterium]
MFLADGWKDFEVLDTGGGEKLERWGSVVLARPDPQTIWKKQKPEMWKTADARYIRSERGGGSWEILRPLPESWTVSYRELKFRVRPTGFKHTGLFPEQAANWDWMSGLVSKRVSSGKPCKVLNLFAYTGGASVACAAAGASVTHVDAAKGMVTWAKENRQECGLPEERFRFIVEDALAFVRREIRRGNSYDGILMDPPSYGRGPNGEVWKLEDEVFSLVSTCASALSANPLFFLVNSYTTGFQPTVLNNLISYTVCRNFGGKADAQELCLPVSSGGLLPCGASGRWQSNE